ncbi:hypothetical protein H0H81_008227 [Sphagnurus paluster]|uniref:Uncharacterized protein n=1 Tax=Sphagnurus paluster TaxID=117069 RepID=A0A9P7FU98_9AGAR|nr:hypothetical protein H0H81_008227 [Sphagnurus paluster]
MADALPNTEALTSASKIEILDVKGAKVTFGSIFENKKTIFVFIIGYQKGHFFCGSCQGYVEQLATIPSSALASANAQIVVVGCGEWQPIQSYAETTKFTGQIYANPSRALYHALGMNIENFKLTPSGEERRSYVKGTFTAVIQSIKGALARPSLIGKQGKISQLGGEFIFGPGLVCTFAHRMQHTQDHVEVADLVKKAGVPASA